MKFSRKYLVIALLLFPVLFAGGCEIVNPIEGVKAILNTKERTTSVSLVILDTETNKPVGSEIARDVSVKITGRDADHVIDLVNRERSEFTTSDGFLSFAIKDEVIPDQSLPVEINITARADDYFTATKKLTLRSDNHHTIKLRMVPKNRDIEGVSRIHLSAGTIESGVLTEDVIFSTPPSAVNGTRTTVKLRKGTAIETADGQPLTGALSADLYHFTNAASASLYSFPGGFSGLYEDLSGELKNVQFVTAGFINLQIFDQYGRSAQSFSKPVKIEIETGSNSRDYQGNTVADGTEVRVWSMGSDQEDQVWKLEGMETFEQAQSGLYSTVFETDHLSWWNTGWSGTTCETGTVMQMVNNGIRLRAEMFRASDDMYMGSWDARTSNEPGISTYIAFEDAPADVEVYVNLYDVMDNQVASVTISDLCAQPTETIDLGHLDTITVTFIGTGICESQGDMEVRPSFPGWHAHEDFMTWISAGTVVNGELEITLPEAARYDFGAYYEEEFKTYLLDLSGAGDGQVFEETITVPEVYCDGI